MSKPDAAAESSISVCECEFDQQQFVAGVDAEGGEPGRNRTFNPQIKSRLAEAKTEEILTILQERVAGLGKLWRIDATPAQPRP
jgi:hypothetical protein